MGKHEKFRTTMSTKGQVIVPKELRELLDWKPGTRLKAEQTGNGVLFKTERIFPETTIEQVFGSLGYTGPTVSLEEMDEAVMREAKRLDRY